MKKATMQALVNYLNGATVDNLDEIKTELEAELNRNAEKAAANREAYAAARDAILEVLRANPGVEMTAAEITYEANLPASFTTAKVQYGLLHYWEDIVVKHEHSKGPNTYSYRE